jgi:hypothetical protein
MTAPAMIQASAGATPSGPALPPADGSSVARRASSACAWCAGISSSDSPIGSNNPRGRESARDSTRCSPEASAARSVSAACVVAGS